MESPERYTMIDVILPALDEAAALPLVLPRLPQDYRAIVVDNGSADATAIVAAELGATVVREPRRGFGAACFAGLCAAAADVVCFLDADGSLDPSQLPRVAEPVAAGRADLVLAARRATPGAWPAHARVANRYLAFEVRRRTGLHLHDLGPMRAARRTALLELGMADRHSGWPLEMVLRAAAAGWHIQETTADYVPRVGRSKVTGTIRGTWGAVRDMAAVLVS
jgi:glycosyltransferase involved in cell wall biosynthesis